MVDERKPDYADETSSTPSLPDTALLAPIVGIAGWKNLAVTFAENMQEVPSRGPASSPPTEIVVIQMPYGPI